MQNIKNPLFLIRPICAAFGLFISSIAFAQHHDHDDHKEHGEHEEHEEHEKHNTGDHGGRLLEQEDVTIELAIFEKGVPPRFRAWVHKNDHPIKKGELRVQLTRLGGEIDTFNFTHQEEFRLGNGVVQQPHSFDVQVTFDLAGKQYQWAWEAHQGRTRISEEIARQSGITTTAAGPGVIQETLTSYGEINVPPGQIAQVRPRFPGLLTEVTGDIGDTVEQGQVLARVEANDSLKTYSLRAPISGIITARQANAGESAQDQELFTITQLDPLWAELKIFPSQRPQVTAGQNVVVHTDELRQESTLGRSLPGHIGQPFTISRAEISNSQGKWTPGLTVEGKITVARTPAPLVVDNRALQPFRDWTVVFVKVGEHYEVRPLQLGRRDGQFTEVLSGLKVGDEYVVQNSYLIKADLEKSGAAHVH